MAVGALTEGGRRSDTRVPQSDEIGAIWHFFNRNCVAPRLLPEAGTMVPIPAIPAGQMVGLAGFEPTAP